MIIVSQNKKNIYNFDNVKSIDILSNEIYISDDILSDMGTCIAHYETEERAKEIVIEIAQSYFNAENYKYINSRMTEAQLNDLKKGLVYEMPKE